MFVSTPLARPVRSRGEDHVDNDSTSEFSGKRNERRLPHPAPAIQSGVDRESTRRYRLNDLLKVVRRGIRMDRDERSGPARSTLWISPRSIRSAGQKTITMGIPMRHRRAARWDGVMVALSINSRKT